jgi:O-antigen ligase
MPENWITLEGRTHHPQLLIVAGVIALACAVGAAIPVFVGAAGDDLFRLLTLPALVVLALMLIFSPKALLLFIVLFRASADLVFEQSRLSFGGYQIGTGALINAFVLLIALVLVAQRPNVVPKKLVGSMWAVFLLSGLYGVVTAPVKVDAIRSYLALISYFAMFVSAFYFVRSAQDFKFCVRLVLWSSVIPAIYALLDIALHVRPGGLSEFRLQSTFTHPNIFAFYLTLIISLVFYALKTSSIALSAWKRCGLTAYLILLFSLLILTQTRSAWAACLTLFAAYGLFFERRYLLYLAAAPLAALLIPSVQERLLDLTAGNPFEQYPKLNSFAWRQMIWEAGIKWMQPDHYLLGYGADSFKYYSPTFFSLSGKTNLGAHSIYVQWLFELGIVGVLAFIWMFGRLLWCMGRMVPIDKLGALVMISLVIEYLTISFSDNMFEYLAFNWYLWFLLGGACALVTAELRNRAEVNKSIS